MGLKDLFSKFENFINYLHYKKSAFAKNSYPCKLLGEIIDFSNNEPIITFKVAGKIDNYKMSLNDIFYNKDLVASFSPKDSVKLGNIAFNNIMNFSNEAENKEKFLKIKKAMLSSTHELHYSDYSTIKNTDYLDPNNTSLTLIIPHLNLSIANNKYPFKLVGYKKMKNDFETIIIYTIFGKKEGYQKYLKNIINTPVILNKFHPTEAVKFGFIAYGEEIFFGNKKLR